MSRETIRYQAINNNFGYSICFMGREIASLGCDAMLFCPTDNWSDVRQAVFLSLYFDDATHYAYSENLTVFTLVHPGVPLGIIIDAILEAPDEDWRASVGDFNANQIIRPTFEKLALMDFTIW